MLTQSLNEMNVAEDDVAAAAAAYSHQWLRAYGCVSRCCTSVWQDYFLHALFLYSLMFCFGLAVENTRSAFAIKSSPQNSTQTQSNKSVKCATKSCERGFGSQCQAKSVNELGMRMSKVRIKAAGG